MPASAELLPAPSRAARALALPLILALAALVDLVAASPGRAQDWGDDASDDWSTPQPTETPAQSTSASGATRGGGAGFSMRGGFGFTASPDTFLMNFELPYAFNEYVALGPMMQVGLEKDHTIVAPTLNGTLKIPNLSGSLDRFIPYAFAGLGFAYIDKDQGRNSDGDGAGFMIDAGVGLEYQVSEKVFLGTQMMFNFLPQKVQKQKFFFAWQLAGIRFAF